MSGPERIKGTDLLIKFGTPGVDYKCDMTGAVLDNEDAANDVTTYCDAATGGAKQFFFTIDALQSTVTDAFWKYAWANTGLVVPYRFAPYGNAEPTVDKPHFVGTVKIGNKPPIGGQANSTAVFQTRWDCQEEPTLDDGESS